MTSIAIIQTTKLLTEVEIEDIKNKPELVTTALGLRMIIDHVENQYDKTCSYCKKQLEKKRRCSKCKYYFCNEECRKKTHFHTIFCEAVETFRDSPSYQKLQSSYSEYRAHCHSEPITDVCLLASELNVEEIEKLRTSDLTTANTDDYRARVNRTLYAYGRCKCQKLSL